MSLTSTIHYYQADIFALIGFWSGSPIFQVLLMYVRCDDCDPLTDLPVLRPMTTTHTPSLLKKGHHADYGAGEAACKHSTEFITEPILATPPGGQWWLERLHYALAYVDDHTIPVGIITVLGSHGRVPFNFDIPTSTTRQPKAAPQQPPSAMVSTALADIASLTDNRPARPPKQPVQRDPPTQPVPRRRRVQPAPADISSVPAPSTSQHLLLPTDHSDTLPVTAVSPVVTADAIDHGLDNDDTTITGLANTYAQHLSTAMDTGLPATASAMAQELIQTIAQECAEEMATSSVAASSGVVVVPDVPHSRYQSLHHRGYVRGPASADFPYGRITEWGGAATTLPASRNVQCSFHPRCRGIWPYRTAPSYDLLADWLCLATTTCFTAGDHMQRLPPAVTPGVASSSTI